MLSIPALAYLITSLSLALMPPEEADAYARRIVAVNRAVEEMVERGDYLSLGQVDKEARSSNRPIFTDDDLGRLIEQITIDMAEPTGSSERARSPLDITLPPYTATPPPGTAPACSSSATNTTLGTRREEDYFDGPSTVPPTSTSPAANPVTQVTTVRNIIRIDPTDTYQRKVAKKYAKYYKRKHEPTTTKARHYIMEFPANFTQ